MAASIPSPMQAKAAVVREAVASPASCSRSTLTTLNELLKSSELPPPSQHGTTSARTAVKSSAAVSRRPRTVTVSTAKVKRKVAVLEIPEARSPSLSSQDKLFLTTQVVNACLKSLTAAVKAEPHGRRQSASKRASTPRTSTSSSAASTKEPLKCRTINTAPSSARTTKCGRKSSTPSVHTSESGLYSTAECAISAFAYMSSLPPTDHMPALQLAKGISALIGKCIALGFDDLAIKEVKVLRQQLEKLAGKPGCGHTKAAEKTLKSKPRVETLADLIRFEVYDNAEPVISLIVTTQMHILRLIASSTKPQLVEAAVDHLLLSSASSPVNMILMSASHNTSGERIGKQLESLSQLVMSLCPSASTAADETASESKRYAPADTILRLQKLALDVRWLGWKYMARQGEVDKEILQPFGHCLNAFSRRSSMKPREKYTFAAKMFAELQQSFKEHDVELSPFNVPETSPLLGIFRALIKLAQDGSRLEDAMEWTKHCLIILRKQDSTDARRCALSVRLSSLLLERSLEAGIQEDSLEVLQSTAAQIQDHLRGDSAALDALLTEVAALRRTIIVCMSNVGKYATTSYDKSDLSRKLSSSCRCLISGCLRFLSRYIGSESAADPNTKATARSEQRRTTAHKIAMATVESMHGIIRAAITSNEIQWDTLDADLQRCVELASKLSECADEYFIKTSNLYWAFFLRQQGSPGQDLDSTSIKCLRRSVEVASLLSPEGRRSALYAVKLERLGSIYYSSTQFNDAATLFYRAIEAHVEDGVLEEVAKLAQTNRLKGIWNTEGPVTVLGRALGALLKARNQVQPMVKASDFFFDDISLDAGTRGAILEWQLESLLQMIESSRTPAKYQHITSVLTKSLMETYGQTDYPLRRARVIINLMRLDRDHPELLETDMRAKVRDYAKAALPVDDFGEDELISHFHAHLKGSLNAMIALSDDQIDAQRLKEALSSWMRMVDHSNSWVSLGEKIDDLDQLLSQLHSMADFLDLKGVPVFRLPTLKLITRIREAQGPRDESSYVAELSALASQYLHLGYSGKAGSLLAKIQGVIQRAEVSTRQVLQWHLTYAEYFLVLGNKERCSELLEKASEITTTDKEHQNDKRPIATMERIAKDRLLADACQICSELALTRGDTAEAFSYAKKGVRLNYRAWATLEGRSGSKAPLGMTETSDAESDVWMESTADSTVLRSAPPIVSRTHQSLNGAKFWSLVPCLHRGLQHLSQLFLHQGLSREASFYQQQAQRILEAVRAEQLLAQSLARAGDRFVRANRCEKGEEMLCQSKALVDANVSSKTAVFVHEAYANLYNRQQNTAQELAELVQAEKILDTMMSSAFQKSIEELHEPGEELEERLAQLTVTDTVANKRPMAIRSRKPATRAPKAKSVALEDSAISTGPAVDCAELAILRGLVLRRKGIAMAHQLQTGTATSLLAEAEKCLTSPDGFVQQCIAQTMHLTLQSLQQMSGDAVFCVLQESTISFPAVTQSAKGHQRTTSEKSLAAPSSRSAPLTSGRRPAKTASRSGDFVEMLTRGKDQLSEVISMAMQVCSVSTIHSLSSALSGVTMLLSAAASGRSQLSLHPLMTAYAMEVGRTLSLRREMEVIKVEKSAWSRESLLDWPVPGQRQQTLDPTSSFPLDYNDFQRDYIDILPANWTALTVSLSEDQSELYISRLQAGSTPFILRLPLGRHKSRDADEEIFDFRQCRTELQEIIELANFSAHDARDMTSSGAKSEWWAEREALDARLKDLLINIENMWLGGFRGIFSQQNHRFELLARFQQSFHKILEKHLPSRQKGNRRSKTGKLALDLRILELFVGLNLTSGAAGEEADLEEPLMDLLYFVVDILQFNGELNAYDEIDFDSIVVECQDALRCYHQAAKDAIKADLEEGLEGVDGRHSILILDKSLHSIPWESLPCLEGASVSRLPSLGCLRDRLVAARRDRPAESKSDQRVEVDGGRGAYVLNPAGDLTATQAVFEDDLKRLSSWTSQVKRDPSEAEMRTALESNDIFLYFGHGSGAQYIRSRTIKRLDRCAVALLMGCSSGKLHDEGEYESWGVPIDYLHAGCPALLATLWDVTDKDIDRFSHSVLQQWGLLPTTSTYPSSSRAVEKARARSRSGSAPRGKSKGKSKAVTTTATSLDGDVKADTTEECIEYARGTSLVEAVARSRDRCVLRYLNGAAAVVYGVPVWIA